MCLHQFTKLVKQVHIDEAHNIYIAGIPLYGQPAFRPAWGNLEGLYLWLPKQTPFQALFGTLSHHIVECIMDKLVYHSDYKSICLTLNRPNITYTAYPITGLHSNFCNLNFVILECREPFDIKLIPKTIISRNNLQEAASVAIYLNGLFPETMRHLQIAKHYHSVMSLDYLEQTSQDFASPEGITRILCAASSASTVYVNVLCFYTLYYCPFPLLS
jgi:hypothetical protein